MPLWLSLLLLTCCFLSCGLYYYFVWYLSFGVHIKWTGSLYMAFVLCCWVPKAPQKLNKSHWCVPFTATFSKRRKIGALWSERCDALLPFTLNIIKTHVRGTLFPVRCLGQQLVIEAVTSTGDLKAYIDWVPVLIHWSITNLFISYPEGCAAPSFVPCQCYTREPLSKLERTSPHIKINVTSKSPVGDISVVTLIRTDTTLDHSQKAEKVCSWCP